MKLKANIKYIWHKLWWNYNLLLYHSCLDEQLKQKLKSKADYHEDRLKAILRSW
ncbi:MULTISPECIES: hypothetical protein [unclassified Paenibacillus]|uniref:hypothetical protein n=1 Tax=unclassified Paenibacillus TaxID=185978 RepID=UPI001AE6F716|nr:MULTISPECIES: hypothetical protein [unclassified Paenibacillus]MBP1154412.1 hypothetical protein [Paenibacillus sp. PvP091]MBP1170204.1 hypothetical protein [Paenibacillus sp. PvR098]MBP2441232.1 hypothetical protein [Paenibacillus sp. PvP052]